MDKMSWLEGIKVCDADFEMTKTVAGEDVAGCLVT